MAESRRVAFTTLTCDSPSSSSSSSSSSTSSSSSDLQVQECPSGSVQQADGTGPDRTGPDRTAVRLVLSLFESDERRFPEFSFTQLTRNQLKHSKDEGPLFTSEQREKRENDEVAAIARKLEEKYPNKKEDRIQDLIDIGFGYDDEDSFIDNSEPYDEFVPASITTKFGGFYVNSGVLLFRPASDTETIDLTMEETSKKRKLHGGQDKPKKKTKPCREDEEMKCNLESSTLSEIGPDNKMKQRKKKKSVGTLSVTGMLKKFQREKEKEKERQNLVKVKPRPASGVTGLPTMPRCAADAAGGGGSGLADPLLSLIGSTNDHVLIQAASTVDFDIDLVSLLDSEETLSSGPQTAAETQLFTPTINYDSRFLTVPQPRDTKTNPEQIQLLSEAGSSQLCPPLPEGLPPALEDSVRTLMTLVKISEGESKLKFFTPEINSILLRIELQCRGQTGQLRSRLYTHLSSFLPCSRETLLKRVKKLLVAHMEEPPDVDDSIQRLKEAIAKAMPEQIAKYHTNYQAYEQVKTSKTTEDGSEVNQTVNVAPEDGVKRGGPKKLFKWNKEIRECLGHVLRQKMDRYEKKKNGNQEVEEFLKTLLDNEVKPLWPKGWMQTRPLIRESRELLGFFTSLPVKKTRPDKKQVSISGAFMVLDVLQGAPPLKVELPQEPDVFPVASNTSNSIPLDVGKKEAAPLKSLEAKKGGGVTAVAGSSPPAESGEPLVSAASAAPAQSLLNLLADQALARAQPLAISQEILAAAIAKYRRSGQHWSYGVDAKRPPPPPQSSPVNFPVGRVCQVVLPQPGDFTRNLDVQVIPDDSCIIIQ